jgi:hypothetical protein
VITEYGGVRTATPQQATHVLRIRGSDPTIDGAPLSQSLVYDPTTRSFWPRTVVALDDGFGALRLANSSEGNEHANAVLLWTWDDIGRRKAGYVASQRSRFPHQDVYPRRPFLVASRPIPKGAEIKLKYQVRY